MFFYGVNLNCQKRLEIQKPSDAIGLERRALPWIPIQKQDTMRADFVGQMHRRIVEDHEIHSFCVQDPHSAREVFEPEPKIAGFIDRSLEQDREVNVTHPCVCAARVRTKQINGSESTIRLERRPEILQSAAPKILHFSNIAGNPGRSNTFTQIGNSPTFSSKIGNVPRLFSIFL